MTHIDYANAITAVLTLIVIPAVAVFGEDLIIRTFVETRELRAQAAGSPSRRLQFEFAAGIPRIGGLSYVFLALATTIIVVISHGDLEQHSYVFKEYGNDPRLLILLVVLAGASLIAGMVLAQDIYNGELFERAGAVDRYHAPRNPRRVTSYDSRKLNEQLLGVLAASRRDLQRTLLNSLGLFALFAPLAAIFAHL